MQRKSPKNRKFVHFLCLILQQHQDSCSESSDEITLSKKDTRSSERELRFLCMGYCDLYPLIFAAQISAICLSVIYPNPSSDKSHEHTNNQKLIVTSTRMTCTKAHPDRYYRNKTKLQETPLQLSQFVISPLRPLKY